MEKLSNRNSELTSIAGINTPIDFNIHFCLTILGCRKQGVVYDMHAEVLAKKGFLAYVKNYLNKNSNNDIGSNNNNNLTIHMYVSSAPCGNSVIKKWAKPSLGSLHENLPYNQWPPNHKQTFYYTAKHEGQGCLLKKKNTDIQDRDINSKLKFNMPQATGVWLSPKFEDINDKQKLCHKTSETPEMIKYRHSFTCSDKILFWQHLGLQGSNLLINGCFERPLHLSTITVGRKFSEPHLIRALYGRYSPNKALINKGAPRQHPMVCLVTCLKLDESVYSGEETSGNATFTDPRCYWWHKVESDVSNIRFESESISDGYQEILDGKTGKVFITGHTSKIIDLKTRELSDLNINKDPTKRYYSITEYNEKKKLILSYFESVQPAELHLINSKSSPS